MVAQAREPILIVRVKGSATKDGRIALEDLLQLGKHIQSSVERVARVLVGQTDSRRRGPKPKKIAASCPLEVVAISHGSFALALDLPRDRFENMDLGVESVEKLLLGLETLGSRNDVLPAGYDVGVLHSLKEMGRVLHGGIDEVELETKTIHHQKRVSFNSTVHREIIARIRGPITSLGSVEGRLMMVDFNRDKERCRIHPPIGDPVNCQFDESLEETVYEYLRRYVKVTGETHRDPSTGRITMIVVKDVEPVSMEGVVFESGLPDDFWKERSLAQLAADQGVAPVNRLEDVFGKGADLWSDEDDFEGFVAATKGKPTAENDQ